MDNLNTEQKTEEQIWDELLNSEDGQAALEALLKEAEEDIQNGNITED